MFSAVSTNSNKRLLEANSLIAWCRNNPQENSPIDDRCIVRGTIYVILYGALEYTITHCVYRAIELINNEELELYKVKSTLWGLIFDPDCTRMESAGQNKKWENRYKLFEKLNKDTHVPHIMDSLFPSSNGNIKETQLERVWQTFGISSPMFEPEKLSVNQDLLSLASGRMAIAHGREEASTVGARVTNDEIKKLYDSISRYCSYLVECFTLYIQNKEYLQ